MSQDCTPKCGEVSAPISASSIIYKGKVLTCIGAEIPETLEVLVHKIDKAICDKLKDIGSLNQLKNEGEGIELYLGESTTGQKEIATLTSPDESIIISFNSSTKEVGIELDFSKIQNDTKVKSADYLLLAEDNSYTIIVDATNNDITITVPSTGIPTDKYFVKFIQKGNQEVTINGFDIKPSGHTNVIKGEGHSATIEIIGGEVFLTGSLKEIV